MAGVLQRRHCVVARVTQEAREQGGASLTYKKTSLERLPGSTENLSYFPVRTAAQ